MPQDIQQGRITAALVARYGIRGRFRPRLDEVIVPVHVVAQEDASELKGTGYQDSTFEAALAGENAVLRWVGAVGGNFAALPKYVIGNAAAAGQFALRTNTTGVSSALTGPLNLPGVSRYTLDQPGSPVRAQVGTFAGGPVGTVRGRFGQTVANEDVRIDLDGFRVGPGQELSVTFSVANTAVNWTAVWDVEGLD